MPYIITGSGCAGLSLLARMMREPFFRDKQILVIDRSRKEDNDRTWCFWEKEPDIFEHLVHHRWDRLDFFSEEVALSLDIDPYRYKMIHGIDLYRSVLEDAKQHPNIEFRQAEVLSVSGDDGKAIVQLKDETLHAEYVFNSIVFPGAVSSPGDITLLQHFKGWFIETPQPAFDPSRATFMDFRVGQERGATFVYVMPVSDRSALVEYTFFTEETAPQAVYEQGLRSYIASTLGIGQYTITHEEYGIIPMTTRKMRGQEGRVVNMGIAGGQVKGSSGYAFRFIQKRTADIVSKLLKGESDLGGNDLTARKFRYYDKVLLDVLQHKRMPAADIFARIFQRNPPERVLQFLDNESGLAADLAIMRSVPPAVFLPAGIRCLW